MAWTAAGKWIPDPVLPQPGLVQTMNAPVVPPVPATTGLIGRPMDPRRQARLDARAARQENRPDRVPRQPGQPGQPPVPGTPPVVPPVPPATPPLVPGQTPTVPGPGPGQPYVDPAPTLADASVENRLNGLLSQDSLYMQLARKSGMRTAARRGLLNSSIAAGSAEAAAIAAAAPIASQDAQQLHQTNQSRLESHLQFGNATRLQSQQDAAALQRQLSGQQNQKDMQLADINAAMDRLMKEGVIQKDLAGINNTAALTREQISANSQLISNYMAAIGAMAQNPELPAAARNAFISEMKMVIAQGMNLQSQLTKTTITWPTINAPTTTAPGTTPPASGAGAIAAAWPGGATGLLGSLQQFGGP